MVVVCFVKTLQASHGYEKASGTLLHHGADVTITDDHGKLFLY